MPSLGDKHKQHQEDQGEPGRSSRRAVLLVEDNPTDAFVIQGVVASYNPNLAIHVARDGHDALAYLEKVADEEGARPVLVLLDLNLPKVRGIEVLRQLRGGERYRGVPVIVITSSSEDADRKEAQRLGADDYFQKPADLAAYMALAEVIRRTMGNLDGGSDPATGS